MTYRTDFLSRRPFTEVYDTFLEAFSDYALDVGAMTEEKIYNRALKNGLDLDASVGVFHGDRMVGFTLVGVDRWNGAPAAFDIGTGIVKAHRGRGLVKALFDLALPSLRQKGIRSFVLEVLKENEAAIRAYRKSGFRPLRSFDCFELSLTEAHEDHGEHEIYRIEEADRSRLAFYEDHVDWQPSWENSFSSMRRIPDDLLVLEALEGDGPVGLVAYYPNLNWMTTLVVATGHRRKGVARCLIRALCKRVRRISPTLKAVNVLDGDRGMIALLEGAGFKKYVSQYEMGLAM